MNKGEWGKLRAFFDLETEDGFVIKGFKLVNGVNGLFVGFPSQKGNDDEWRDTVYAAQEIKDELSKIAIDYYGQEIMPIESGASSGVTDDTSTPGTAAPATSETSEDTTALTDDDIPF